MTKLERERLQKEFANWLCLDKAARRSFDLPATQTEWAEWKGVSTRALRRWRERPQFQRWVEQRQEKMVKGAVGATVSKNAYSVRPKGSQAEPVENGEHPELVGLNIDDPGLRDYETLKRQLKDRAISGESEKALELYMRWWGQPYLEAEKAALQSTFADLSDGELVDKTLSLIGEGAVRAWLER